jgi:2-polyprenyl-3-methyl-5-hydroxy-6-metoxy-1,4-benzoquinol methylase
MNKYYRKRLYNSYVSSHTGQQIGDKKPYVDSFRDYNWRFNKILPKNREIYCLDIACGAGTFLYFLKQKGYKNIIGVDISPEQVALAKQVCDDVHEVDVKEYLASGRGYDMITIFSFIEHLTRDEALTFLDNVYKSLRPGGRIILVTPNADSPFAAHMRYGDITHEVIYNQGSLASLLRVCGFVNCEAFETGPVPHGIISCIRWILWKVISGMLQYYRLVEGGSAKNWIFTTEFIMVADKPK